MTNIAVNDRPSKNTFVKALGGGPDIDPYIMQVGITSEGQTTLGELDVNIQDQTTDTLILPLAQQLGMTTLFSEGVPNLSQIAVDSAEGMSVGDHIRIINKSGDRYYAGEILNIAGVTIDVDSPVDFPYEVGSEVTWSNINLAVDGSVTPAHFHLRTGDPSIPSSIDVTRMLMVCQTTTAVDLSKFGNIIGGLTKGIVFRLENGATGLLRNIFNIKTNAGLAGIAYDWTPYAASNPQQGVDGFAWRLTFGSAGKMGVVIRVDQFGQLGMIVQDDLSGLTSLFCVIEGHVTTGE